MRNCRRRIRNRFRSTNGASLTELLIASLLVVVVSAIIGELMVAITASTLRLSNREDCLISARTAIRRIVSTVRSSKRFVPRFSPTIGPRSWPAAPWELDGQSLLVQVQTFTNDVDGAFDNLGNSATTVVFKVVADSQHPGEFLLQSMKYSSSGVAIYDEPQTIATGIVNQTSTDPNSLPNVFSYYTRDTNGGVTTIGNGPIGVDSRIKGVYVDFKVRKMAANERHQQSLNVRTEAFSAIKTD